MLVFKSCSVGTLQLFLKLIATGLTYDMENPHPKADLAYANVIATDSWFHEETKAILKKFTLQISSAVAYIHAKTVSIVLRSACKKYTFIRY